MKKLFSIFTALVFLITLTLTSCDKTNVDRFELIPDEIEVDTLICAMSIELVETDSTNPVTIEAFVDSGTPPYTYLWSDSSTVNPVEVFQPGVYGITVTDTNGCTIESSLFVDTPEPCDGFSTEIIAEVDTAGNTTLTAVVMGGVAPYTYIWSDSSTFAIINVSASGTYSVTTTDDNGCESEDEIML